MKGPLEAVTTREYPHVVMRGGRHLERVNLVISNEPLPRFNGDEPNYFHGIGLLDADDKPTPMCRKLLLRHFTGRARGSNFRFCIVWSPTECTWLGWDGEEQPGDNPPIANWTIQPFMYDRFPIPTENCWTIKLPEGHEPPYICIMQIDAHLVEVAAGEPVSLAYFDDVIDGERDPAEGLYDAEGNFTPPAMFRGQPVLEAIDDELLLGPVQPWGEGIIIRNPWPIDIKDACEKVARMPLSQDIIDQAWRAARPDHLPYTPVGILKAA